MICFWQWALVSVNSKLLIENKLDEEKQFNLRIINDINQPKYIIKLMTLKVRDFNW